MRLRLFAICALAIGLTACPKKDDPAASNQALTAGEASQALEESFPGAQEDRARFAEQAARSIAGLRNARLISNEAIRIDSTPGFETRIEAVTGKNDTPVSIVQWLRFGSGATLRIIASATRDDWPQAFPRFRAVRDGVGPK